MPIKAKKSASTANAKALQDKVLSQKRNVVRQAFLSAGEDAVTYARDVVNTYLDQSSNLRSSIGFAIAENGNVTATSSFEQLAPKNAKNKADLNGGEIGRSKALQIVKENSECDFILALVAGMKYAYYVQEYHHLDVLAGACLELESSLKLYLKSIK